MSNILVLCTGNSCRSQIAEGFFKKYLDDAHNVYSAGIETHGLNPLAVETMKEIGIDISHNSSNLFDEYVELKFDYVITVCDHARENCPYIPASTSNLHQNFSDPSKVKGSEEEILNAFRSCRTEIGDYAKGLSAEINSK